MPTVYRHAISFRDPEGDTKQPLSIGQGWGERELCSHTVFPMCPWY